MVHPEPPLSPRRSDQTMDGIGRVVWPALLTIVLGAIAPGCNQIAVLPVPGHRLRTVAERWHPPCPSWSGSTAHLLSHLGLDDLARRDPCAAFAALEPDINGARSDSVRLLALAELADEVGRSLGASARDDALAWSRDAAVYAVLSLSASAGMPGAEAMGCTACAVHNRAAARCLRLAPHLGPTRPEPLARAVGDGRHPPHRDRPRVDRAGIRDDRTHREPDGHRDRAPRATRRAGRPPDRSPRPSRRGSRRLEAVRPRASDVRRHGPGPAPRIGGDLAQSARST